MTELIQRELLQILIMFYCGMAIMMIFEVRDMLVIRAGGRGRLAKVIYFTGWICAAYLFSRFLYGASHGVVTLYGILSMSGGIILWKSALYGIIFPRR